MLLDVFRGRSQRVSLTPARPDFRPFLPIGDPSENRVSCGKNKGFRGFQARGENGNL